VFGRQAQSQTHKDQSKLAEISGSAQEPPPFREMVLYHEDGY